MSSISEAYRSYFEQHGFYPLPFDATRAEREERWAVLRPDLVKRRKKYAEKKAQRLLGSPPDDK